MINSRQMQFQLLMHQIQSDAVWRCFAYELCCDYLELMEFKYIDKADILITVCSYHSVKQNNIFMKYSLIKF